MNIGGGGGGGGQEKKSIACLSDSVAVQLF